MLNSKHLVVGLSLAGSLIVSSEVANSVPEQSSYFCYRQTAYGQVTDLTEMCQKARQRAVSANAGASSGNPSAKQSNDSEASTDRVRIEGQARRKKVEFSDYNYDGAMLVGSLKNRTGKPISDIYIVYEVQVQKGEGKWQPVDNGRVRANNRDVAKGGKTNFSDSPVRKGDRIVITDVEFN